MICRLPIALVKPDEFISNVLAADRRFLLPIGAFQEDPH